MEKRVRREDKEEEWKEKWADKKEESNEKGMPKERWEAETQQRREVRVLKLQRESQQPERKIRLAEELSTRNCTWPQLSLAKSDSVFTDLYIIKERLSRHRGGCVERAVYPDAAVRGSCIRGHLDVI